MTLITAPEFSGIYIILIQYSYPKRSLDVGEG